MQGRNFKKGVVRAIRATSVSVLALGAMIGASQASGIINSSQSTVFNGMAYAGAAAPGSSSPASMFMNPATMTSFTRFTLDTNYTFGVPNTKVNGGFNAGPPTAFSRSSGDIGVDYFSPATYIVYPVNDRIVVGVSINGTYGNSTKPGQFWQGSFLAATSKLRIITATPSVAYKINEMFSIGLGLQIQYASARQYAFPGGPAVMGGITEADGWGVGFTAGITFTPTKTTQIGLGWRSFVDHKVEGTAQLGGFQDTNASGTLNLPNRVNLSLRQTLSPKFDLLASVEWQNLSRLGNARLNTVIPQLAAAGIPFGYKDGWFFSLGGEYRYNDALTLRAGIGYEISGVTDSVRRLSLPDNDRLWLSAGLTYEITQRFALNASYSYLHIKKAPITQTLGPLTFTGQAKSDAHLLSIGLTSKWGEPPRREALVTKY